MGVCEHMVSYNIHFKGSYWKVERVYDGDTIKLRSEAGEVEIIRLWGIDAPEHGQLHFRESRKRLRELMGAQAIEVKGKGPEKYGRTLGEITCKGGDDINLRMVREGAAWWYKGFCRFAKDLRNAEIAARAERLGLWRENRPIPPWNWRHGAKKERSEGEGGQKRRAAGIKGTLRDGRRRRRVT